ncbi:MAG: alpha/beta hydrolase, partial [Salinisphaera sp.]|nr:alpha/beta hydrolase [Salinisphaera sp.]
RGYGRSSKFHAASAYRIDQLVGDVLGVIRHYDSGPAVVVGHDWGAPVAWTTAWLHPELVRGVVGVSIPFAGRGLIGLPGNPFGEIRPSAYHDRFTGPDQIFYQQYFGERGAIIDEIEAGLRDWLLGILYTVSGEAVAAAAQAGQIPADPLEALRTGPLCLSRQARLKDAFVMPESLPDWLTEDDLAFFVAELQYSGLAGPLGYYHQVDAGWEWLEAHAGAPLVPPALFIGGEFDVGTAWGVDNIKQAQAHCGAYRGSHIVPGSGHWIQQEKPEETNRCLLHFLASLGQR